MPFCIGAHTAIRIPDGERFEDYELLFDEAEAADSHLLSPQGIILHDGRKAMLDGTGALALDYQDFAEMDTIIFSLLRSGNVSLVHRETGRGVRLDFHEFPMVSCAWSPGRAAPPGTTRAAGLRISSSAPPSSRGRSRSWPIHFISNEVG